MRIPITKIGGLPPLPLLTNKDAEAAYSLRKLSPSYSGSAVRIRRESDDSEQDIGFNGLDFDSASAESFCGVGNGFVTTWYDQSGNGNNATQATASSQPQIVSSGSVVTENSKPAIDFDGIDDLLTIDIDDINQPASYFNVRRYEDITGTQISLGFQGQGSSYGDIVISSDLRMFFGSYLEKGLATTNQELLYGLANGSNSEIRTNGVTVSGNAGEDTLRTIEIGGVISDFYANVKTQEVIVYSSDKSSSLSVIEADINRYYNIF